MNRALVASAVAAVRVWTRCYTCRLPPDVALARRAEIDSDLWEFVHDMPPTANARVAAAIVRRLGAGVADDVLWRIEQLDASEALLVRRTLTVACAFVLILIALLIPARLTRGRAEVLHCASVAAPADSTAEYRLQIVNCAGAFFRAPE